MVFWFDKGKKSTSTWSMFQNGVQIQGSNDQNERTNGVPTIHLSVNRSIMHCDRWRRVSIRDIRQCDKKANIADHIIQVRFIGKTLKPVGYIFKNDLTFHSSRAKHHSFKSHESQCEHQVTLLKHLAPPRCGIQLQKYGSKCNRKYEMERQAIGWKFPI